MYIGNAEQNGVEHEGGPWKPRPGTKPPKAGEKQELSSELTAKRGKGEDCCLPPTPCSPRYVPHEPTRYPQPQRDSVSHLLPCLFQNPSCKLLPLASNQSFIHSCMRAFTQQMFTENGFWQESRFHLALEQGCWEIAKRK